VAKHLTWLGDMRIFNKMCFTIYCFLSNFRPVEVSLEDELEGLKEELEVES
jgi:hypothetical protein